MGRLGWQEIVAAAIVIPVVSLLAVWAARKVGRFFMRAASRSFAEVVLEVMAPDMAHLSTKVTGAIDDLNHANTVQHVQVQGRLVGVEGRLTDVEARLATVESRLQIRAPDTRTRSTDKGM